jgi:hypothetical protein
MPLGEERGDGSSDGGGSWDRGGGWNISRSGGCWDISHGRGDDNGVGGGGDSGCTINSSYGSALTCWAPMGVRLARCNGGGWVHGGGLDSATAGAMAMAAAAAPTGTLPIEAP